MRRMFPWLLLLVSSVGLLAQEFGETVLVHEFTLLDFDWPSESDKEEASKNETYFPERNVIAGIKIYKDQIYLSVPRWFWTSGHPVTLAKLVEVDGQVKLRPYPSWAAQKQGDCGAMQFVWSMEIDPNTGLMYVLDKGRVGMKLNLCPSKIWVYDLNTDQQVAVHELPDEVASNSRNFLNDLVLDYVDGRVRYAYITDANEGYLVVYDFQTRQAFKLEHDTMKAQDQEDSVLNITGQLYKYPVPIDGIAMSPDFDFVYFSILGGFDLFQVPTSALRSHNLSDDGVRSVGRKVSQGDGMVHGAKRLYYGAIPLNAVYYWDVKKDLDDQKVPLDRVSLDTQEELVRDDAKLHWPDTFALDEQGWLWFVSNRLHLIKTPKFVIDPKNPNMRIWKVYVNDTSYLYQADVRTSPGSGDSREKIVVSDDRQSSGSETSREDDVVKEEL